MSEVIVGQRYKCKRRGHVVLVTNVYPAVNGKLYAHVDSSSGRCLVIEAARLLKPYRFECIESPAVIHALEAAGA